MATLVAFLTWLPAVCWIGLLLLPWRPWLNGETLAEADHGAEDFDHSLLTVLIPARNEAEVIAATLESIADQGEALKVILVDDGSSDGTADVARTVTRVDLTVIDGEPLPSGWSGKLWALEQGIQGVRTPYTLLLDADIRLAPGVLAALMQRARAECRQFLSVMASLRMESFWEKLLMPAFIHFFKLLYPFRLANSANPRFSAAAGGCILLETRLIREIGGFGAIRGSIIDDCSLARKVKALGASTWIGQSHGVVSLRAYPDLQSVWDMVARTAYTQLRYSPLLLVLCSVVMLAMFWLPLAGLLAPAYRLPSGLALAGMLIAYLPTLSYYRKSPLWALAMPAIAGLYLAMTWSSALRYWRGEASRWKARVYAADTIS
jgi:hopene-associated glycosyltransferase HpnB